MVQHESSPITKTTVTAIATVIAITLRKITEISATLMQITYMAGQGCKVNFKNFKYLTTSLDFVLNTPNCSDMGYYIVCDVDYNDICK